MRVWIVVAGLFLWNVAEAAEPMPHWGMVVGGFFRNSNVHGAIIHRTSERSAWAMDLRVWQSEWRLEPEVDSLGVEREFSDGVEMDLGPRYRRYTRGGEGLSPHVDVFAAGTYSRYRSNSYSREQRERATGIRLGTGFGLEYRTRWNVSAAGYTDLLSFQYEWIERKGSGYINPFNPPPPITYKGHRDRLTMYLAPEFELRVYF